MKSLTIYIENQNATSLVWLANQCQSYFFITFLDSIVSCVYVQVQTNVVHVRINHLYLHHLPCRYIFLHLHMGSVSDCQIHLHNAYVNIKCMYHMPLTIIPITIHIS
jgi:hypothetical protein